MGFDRIFAGCDQDGEGALDAPACRGMFCTREIDGGSILRRNLIGPQAGARKQAIAHRIAETTNVARRNENLLHRKDRAVHTEHVVAFLHGFAPPIVLEITLQLGAQWTVVPATIQTTIELSSLENKAAAFAQGDDFFHAGGIGNIFVGHKNNR